MRSKSWSLICVGEPGLGSGNAQIQVGANAGESVTLPAINFTANSLGISNTSIATTADAQNAIGSIDTALHNLNSTQSTLGATVNSLNYAGNNLDTATTNTQAAESLISDEDMATGLTQLTTQSLLQQGAIATFARFNQITQNHILGLLQ